MHKFTDEQINYIRKIASGRYVSEITEMFNKHFNLNLKVSQIVSCKHNHNIASGIDCRFQKGMIPANKGKKGSMSPDQYKKCAATMFKKGNIPQNHRPVANQPIKEEVEETENKAKNLDTIIDDKVANLLINHYKEQLQTITNQLQEMTQQRDYFKAKFEEKDTLCNQYMNSHLLPPIEDELERNSRENKNKGFFWKLFNK